MAATRRCPHAMKKGKKLARNRHVPSSRGTLYTRWPGACQHLECGTVVWLSQSNTDRRWSHCT